MSDRFKIIVRLLLGGILFVVIVFLFWQAIVPGGKIVYHTDFSDDNFFILKFTPEERVEMSDSQIKIIANPVYFNLRTPRTFDGAQIKLVYQNNSDSIIELGPLVDKDLWRYRLQPLENKVLEQVDIVWLHVNEGPFTLWQRPNLSASSTYADLDEFLTSPPDFNRIAVYNYDPDFEYIIPEYEASDEVSEWSYSLRGDWQVFVYLADEELRLSVDIVDLNQNLDSDEAELRLYYENELLSMSTLPDDDNQTDNGEVSGPRKLEINQSGLPSGVYKLEFRAGDDLVSKRLISAQEKFVFNGKLNFHKDNNTNVSFWTDSNEVQALTVYPESFQNIMIGQGELELSEVYTQFKQKVLRASSSDQVAQVILAEDGVQITGDGTFALDKKNWFNPKLKKITSDLDINEAQIDYILANYRAPSETEDWREVTLSVPLKDAYREAGQYSILLSLPGIDNHEDQFVRLKSLEIELHGTSLWNKIKELLNEKFN